MSTLLRTTVGPARDVGGGDRRDIDRLRESSTCAFFECDRARLGRAGASRELLLEGRAPAKVFERCGMSKKLTVVLASVETGDVSTDDAGVVAAESSMKLREIVVKSESLPDMIEELDDVVEPEVPLRSLMFGAFRALTLVVESNSVGSEMRFLLMVPAAYLTLPSRVGVVAVWLMPRFVRFVSARAREAIVMFC